MRFCDYTFQYESLDRFTLNLTYLLGIFKENFFIYILKIFLHFIQELLDFARFKYCLILCKSKQAQYTDIYMYTCLQVFKKM